MYAGNGDCSKDEGYTKRLLFPREQDVVRLHLE